MDATADAKPRNVVTIDGARFAVGLRWLVTALTPPGSMRAEIVRFANEMYGDAGARQAVWTWRSAPVTSLGVGSAMDGHAAGVPSLAEVLAEMFEGERNWIVALPVSGGWCVCAARDDAIILDTPVLADEERARKEVLDLLAAGHWSAVACPAPWLDPNDRTHGVAGVVEYLPRQRVKTLRPIRADRVGAMQRTALVGAIALAYVAAQVGATLFLLYVLYLGFKSLLGH